MATPSRQQHIGNGSTQDFVITFPFITRNHVRVLVNNVLQLEPFDYVWVGDNTIRLRAAPQVGDVVVIRRETEYLKPLVDFQNGANLTEEQLDLNTSQMLYLIQEIRDAYESALNSGLVRITNGTSATAQEMIDAVVQEVLNSELLAELNSRITDIDRNAESILDQASRLSEIQEVVDTLLEIDGVGIATYVLNETQARIDGDEALAATISLLGAEANGGTAFILDLDQVMASPTESLAQKFSWLESAVGDNAAAISNEITARVSGDSANASAITTLQTTVNGHTSSIQSLINTTNGLSATYVIKTNVNGHVAGFGLYNSSGTSDFIVQANRFAIVDPSNSSNVKVPFVVSGGTVYMQNVVIADALIDNLSINKLTYGTLNADMNIGSGRIIWSNGTFMKVAGVGFGNANQFIEWFGPYSSNLSNCRESNAISYLKTNGDAYFGGSLLAGTLTNQATSSDTTPTAFAEIGPFGTNGNSKTVTFSYSLQYTAQTSSSSNPGNPTAQIKLYRSYNDGPWTEIATLNVTGSRQSLDQQDPTTWWHFMAASGSQTFTDNMAGTQNFAYRAALVSRNLPGTALAIVQRVSVISVEQ